MALDQLRGLGITPRTAQARVDRNRWHRVQRGVYSLVPPDLLGREGRWLAAVLACGPGAALSHASAAALHGIRASASARIDVTVPARSARRHPGIRLHRSTTLTPADVELVEGIPCTNVARTIVDLAGVIRRRPLERALDQAECESKLNLLALRAQLARNPTARGAHTLAAVLDEYYPGADPTWSDMEEDFRALVAGTPIPMPEINRFIDPGDGEPMIRVDAVWREHRLIVETDGYRTHGTRQAFENDRRRDQRLTAAGWRVIRMTSRQIRRLRDEMRRLVMRLLGLEAAA